VKCIAQGLIRCCHSENSFAESSDSTSSSGARILKGSAEERLLGKMKHEAKDVLEDPISLDNMAGIRSDQSLRGNWTLPSGSGTIVSHCRIATAGRQSRSTSPSGVDEGSSMQNNLIIFIPNQVTNTSSSVDQHRGWEHVGELDAYKAPGCLMLPPDWLKLAIAPQNNIFHRL
jgi:hypothetical protein